MQHAACINSIDIPWILQNLLFLHTSFWQELSINISNHLPDSSFAYFGQPDLINSLIFADIYPGWGFPACMYRQCQHTPDFQSI